MMAIVRWMCPTLHPGAAGALDLAGEGSTHKGALCILSSTLGSWEEGASLSQTSDMGKTGRKIVMA